MQSYYTSAWSNRAETSTGDGRDEIEMKNASEYKLRIQNVSVEAHSFEKISIQ